MANNTDEVNLILWSEYIQTILLEESPCTKVIYVAFLCIIFTISLVGNLLTCVVIYYDKTMHTTTNYYLFNLAISDLLISSSILLLIYIFIKNSFEFGLIACKINVFVNYTLFNNSILTMTALAIERYIAVWHPLLLKLTCEVRRVTKIILFIWFLSIAQSLPELLAANLIKTSKSLICFFTPTKNIRILNGVLAVGSYVIPLCIMTFVYTMIAVKVSMTQTTTMDEMSNRRDNRRRVSLLVVALTASFLVCGLPHFLLQVSFAFADFQHLKWLPQWLVAVQRTFMVTGWLLVVLNPILFSLISNKFRKSLKVLWRKKNKGIHSETTGVIQRTLNN